jgi:uncharacterized Zn finger protein (UPF0148 family)/large-conductance mechanosensitive channel
MKRNKLSRITVLIIIMLLTVGVELLFARAGGGGSSSSSSGGGGGDLGIIYLIFYLMRIIPFPFNFIILAIVVFLYISANKKQKKNKSAFKNFPGQNEGGQAGVDKIKGYSAFQKENPNFNKPEFLHKVNTAFMGIQKAWSEKNISIARRYITDDVHQRFLTQIEMMGILKQSNIISDIEIDNIWIDKIESDGEFDIIHAGISASANDIFKSELSKSLNTDVSEDFIEYWSFIRKKSSKNKDLYGSVECPNCKAPLDGKNSDVVKCTFCGTLLNNGDYDWILSEITQANDYAASRTSQRKLDHVASEIAKKAFENEASIQLIEDKASNAYLQVISAQSTNSYNKVKRFISASYAAKLISLKTNDSIAYNRLFLNDVSLIGAGKTETDNLLYISIRSSFQRIKVLEKNRISKLDPFVVSKTEILIFKKEINGGKSKGSLYAGSCPACGGAVEDELAIKCSYCGTAYNRGDKDWVVEDIISMEEYTGISSREMSSSVKASVIDGVYDIKDYAMNNIMMIIAADGEFDTRERQLAEAVAKKFGYKSGIIDPLFKQAASGRLSIKMPEDSKKRAKIYSLMFKAAMADNDLSSEESKLLDDVKRVYL